MIVVEFVPVESLMKIMLTFLEFKEKVHFFSFFLMFTLALI
jgi:hypothetical protein